MNIKIIGGNFGENPKESGYIKKLSTALKNFKDINLKIINGGKYEYLKECINAISKDNTEILIWMPNIDNSYPKLVEEIKQKYQNLLLVQSKFNNGKYTDIDLVARALKSKANLLIEFTKTENKFNTKIIDPLGNIFFDSTDIERFTEALYNRLKELSNFTRMSSTMVLNDSDIVIPEELEFFKIVEGYGHKYHELIHAVNQERFLGNCSFRKYNFRCSYGFPSFKDNSYIFVSRRNLDKRNINTNSFVPVRLNKEENKVEFCGDKKPSVDTPIQLMLYNKLPNIKYMLHSHVFIEGSKFTDSIVPCGSIEEVDEILNIVDDFNSEILYINLKGHGSIAMVKDFNDLKNIKYIKIK